MDNPIFNKNVISKCCETMEAILNGANEIDFVANIGMIKNNEWKKVEMDMQCVVLAAKYAYQCVAFRKSNITKEDLSIIASSIIGNVEQAKDYRIGLKIPVKYEDLPGFVRHYSRESTKDHELHCVVKVILETCLLSDGEIARACQAAVHANCDFVKTSTGFSTGGATAKYH